MIPKEIISKLRRIKITTSRKVTDVFAGQYQSVFKGVGMEFDEVREYTPGDEIRSIDWNVTARMGHPFIKKFIEERELTIMIVLDVSMSCLFGTSEKLKSDLAAEICSVMAFSAIKNNDKVGMITFTDRIEKFIPPRKGVTHVMHVVREALYNKPEGKGTDIAKVLEFLTNVAKRKAIVFLVSDFMSEGYEHMLAIANKRHDVIAVTITDPSEDDLPEAGMVMVHDAEAGAPVFLDTMDKKTRETYAANRSSFVTKRDRIFSKNNIDRIDFRTDVSYIDPLIRFFRNREKRIARRA